jgi:tetratricopeptide (TPR) repeat protein
MVMVQSCAYDDVAEYVEDKVFHECDSGRQEQATAQLEKLAGYLELVENKNDEVDRVLADVYVLLGDVFMCAKKFEDGRQWFEKAIVVDDNFDVAYHSLADACLRLGDETAAIHCWKQEIHNAPGNYYTYLQLADLFEKREDYIEFVEILEHLLTRDQHNIRALHRLIRHHEIHNPELDVELLRRRLINADHELVKMELVIWTYHMCREERCKDALLFLQNHEQENSGLTLTHLLKAHIYGVLRQYSKKRQELADFKRLCNGNSDAMRQRLNEFSTVFGGNDADRLHIRLIVSHPSVAQE